jgi:hypothetical protein
LAFNEKYRNVGGKNTILDVRGGNLLLCGEGIILFIEE